MVSTTGGITDNNQMSLIASIPVNNHISRKTLRGFYELLDVKQERENVYIYSN